MVSDEIGPGSKIPYDSIDVYGFARVPETIERIPYGRFRNVYLYITDECQLRCGHCYMGERLDRANVMSTKNAITNMVLWRKMGGSKLSILGGEPTLHPDFKYIVSYARALGYEKVILNTNGLASARRILGTLNANDFSYVQVSLDGASSSTHDKIRGKGTFNQAWKTAIDLCKRGFDTRVICTVNSINIAECLNLLPMCEEIGVKLLKYHVFSGIGAGYENDKWLIDPISWIEFYERLDVIKGDFNVQVWYQPTYARLSTISKFASEGYRGCIGRTLDRISVFSDGRAYVCSYLFDTALNYAKIDDGRIVLNKAENEFDLFTSVLTNPSCGSCKFEPSCLGGCPAEQIVMGGASCSLNEDVVPVCRLWKSDI